MPIEATPLFRPEILRPRVRAFELPAEAAEHRTRLTGWVDLLNSAAGMERKETELLPDFLTDVFQGILGYAGPAQAEEGRHTLSRERVVEVDGKFADAVLGDLSSGDDKFVVAVEGKGPKDPLDRPYGGRRMSAVDQAYRYAINLPCDWIVVLNLREIRLYHKGSTQRQYERFYLEDLASDLQEFRKFVFVLGASRVVGSGGRSHLDDLLDASRQAGEKLTQEFYRAYAGIRRHLLNALLNDNPDTDPGVVLKAAQRLLDRTLFVAFAEDRSLLPADSLAKAYQHRDPYHPRPVWENFRALFRAIDQGSEALGIPRYNGGLFAEHRFLDRELEVSDASCECLKRLGDYNYGSPADADEESEDALVDVEILGHIFEQSIEDLEAIQAEIAGGGEVSRSSSKRKREGAFYTPAFVTRYIVTEALGPVLAERFNALREAHQQQAKGTTAVSVLESPHVYAVDALNNPQRDALIAFWEDWIETLKKLRVVDPACGSGAFLIEVFDALHTEYDMAVGHLTELRRGAFAGSLFDPDRTILENNVYGVDLNEEAVEIARLSIWIKTAQRGKVLTDLDHNVQVGNSVVTDPALDAHAFQWWEAFPEVSAQGGFDVVVGNPPYVRAELLTSLKDHLEDRYESYHGAADLYVYFYELGVKLLRHGGRMSYIVTNKWLKTGYAERLREFFATSTDIEEILDLGHARGVFPEADVFPCILRVKKPTGDSRGPVSVCVIPRDEVDLQDLPSQVTKRKFSLPQDRFSAAAWTLQSPAMRSLIEKVNDAGIPLKRFAGAEPSYGIKTGLNEAFLVDTETKERLVREDPNSAEILKPYLRGQDIKRWRPSWDGLWMIFARRGVEIDRYPAVLRYLQQFRERLEPKPSDWNGGKWPGRKGGAYEWYEIQDTVDYWRKFEEPKIVWKDLSYYSDFSYDPSGDYYTNDLCFILPTADLWILAVLNSPLMWSYLWRTTVHGKDEVLRLKMMYMENLPIAEPTAKARKDTEARVRKLLDMAKTDQQLVSDLHDWLQTEFGVEKPGNKLSVPHEIDSDTFVAEVKRRRPGRSTVTSAELRRLREEYSRVSAPLASNATLGRSLEREISDSVNQAYGLTQAEIDLLWETAPPRMPNAARPEQPAA